MSVRHTNLSDEDRAKQNYGSEDENPKVSRERHTYQQAADNEHQHGQMDDSPAIKNPVNG
jgi:hypothetical protein